MVEKNFYSGYENLSVEKERPMSDINCQQIDRISRMIIDRIFSLGADFEVYTGEHAQNRDNASTLPFHISPDCFKLSIEDKNIIEKSSKAVSSFYRISNAIYQGLPADHRWSKWLDHSKPEFIIKAGRNSKESHIFIRPDFILTPNGPILVEIETSPFGLALSIFLNRVYSEYYPNINSDLALQAIIETVQHRQPIVFLITDNTRKYHGQFIYLANLLRERGIQATVTTPESLPPDSQTIYRAFYLYEAKNDPILKRLIIQQSNLLIPPPKAYLEEKALMGMIFDPEFEDFFRKNLGSDFDLLRKIFPPTYVIDPSYLPSELPIKSWLDIANLSASKRQYVIKPSGFSPDSSWSKGVVFLHKLSKKACKELIEKILVSQQKYIIQSFMRGSKFKQKYFDFKDQQMKTMEGRVRITPYFKVDDGTLLTAKGTLCPNTDYIHASITSINSSVI